MRTKSQIFLICLACCLSQGCTTEKFEAKPVSIAQNSAKILAKDIHDPDFVSYLSKHGVASPETAWGLNELTLCALYFHPALNVTKTQLALANASLSSAEQRQNPTLNGNLAHSNLANGDKRPWAYGLSIEIPIETANKREIRMEEAKFNAEAIRMDSADAAWQLRTHIAQDWLEYQQNAINMAALQSELTTHNEVIDMLQKRVDKGFASKFELSAVQLAQRKAQSAFANTQAKSAELLTKLASDVGLTPEKFAQIPLKPLDLESTLKEQMNMLDKDFVQKNLQESALLNRIDIRRALAKYSAAEAKIKLEIAKQTPDITLTPGASFEYGDSIWSLGFSTLLNLANKNSAQIMEAKRLREVEGAQFEALQTQIISDVNAGYAAYLVAQANLENAQNQYQAQSQHLRKLQKQLDAGLIDRLELRQNTLTLAEARQQVLDAQFALLKSTNALENTMQKPIYSDFVMPETSE